MKIPDQVKIGGHWYKIEMNSELNLDRDREGETCPRKLVIIIDSTGAKSHMEESLIHEIIENWNHRTELGLSHDKITLLGFLIHQLLTDNPSLLGDK